MFNSLESSLIFPSCAFLSSVSFSRFASLASRFPAGELD